MSPAPAEGDGPGWGRWFRLVDTTVADGAEVLMTGLDDRPLLTLNRVGEGRVALLASDQSWLWDRGYEGGGPQAGIAAPAGALDDEGTGAGGRGAVGRADRADHDASSAARWKRRRRTSP